MRPRIQDREMGKLRVAHRNAGACMLGIAAAAACGPAQAAQQWDKSELERVAAEIRAEVEDMRDLEFGHPVAVELADKAGFLAHATERMNEMTPDGKFENDQDIARHLAMIPTDMDLLATTMEFLAGQVGGFYSPSSETFYLMESFTGDAAKIILAHELCHALDDQHFDLDAGFVDTMRSTDASTAYASVVEGSGTWLMTRYMFRHAGDLSPAALIEASSASAQSIADTPPYLWKPLLAVYQQGQAFLDQGYRIDKKAKKKEEPKGKADPNESVDGAFERPPRSTEQILHPRKYWVAGEMDEPVAVRHRLGALPSGWSEMHRDTLGELLLGVFTTPLDERTAPDLSDPMAALSLRFTNEAATGWGGDEVLLLGRDDSRIVHLATTWDSSEDTAEFSDAAEALKVELARLAEQLAGGASGGSGVRVVTDTARSQVRVICWSHAKVEEVDEVLAAVRVEVGE